MRNINLVLFFISWLVTTDAQTILNDYCFGGSGNDVLQGVINLSNGNKLLIGTSNSPISGTKTENGFGGIDGYLVMLNSQNQELWQRTIGGISDDAFYSGIELSDGNILIAGSTNSGISGNKISGNFGAQDLWLLKISPTGVVLFDKNYGGSNSEVFFGVIKEISSNRIIIPASSNSGISGNKTSPNLGSNDAWYLKIDFNGNLLSDHVFGGTGLEEALSIEKISENRYVLFNTTDSSNGDVVGPVYGESDVWMIKTDSNFNIIDQQIIGGDQSDGFDCVKIKGQDKFILVSTSSSGISGVKTEVNYGNFDTWILEIDTNLNLLNQRTIGSNADDLLGSFEFLSDGEIVLKISSSSNINSIKSQPSIGWNDLWVVKLDADLHKTYDNVFGTFSNDYFCDFVSGINFSNSFFGSSYGGVNNNKTCGGFGMSDFWILQYDNFLGKVENELIPEFLVFPNPASSLVVFDFSNSLNDNKTLEIYTQDGKLIETLSLTEGSKEFKWNPTVLSGIYFYRIGEQTGKIILNR